MSMLRFVRSQSPNFSIQLHGKAFFWIFKDRSPGRVFNQRLLSPVPFVELQRFLPAFDMYLCVFTNIDCYDGVHI